jgi:MatE
MVGINIGAGQTARARRVAWIGAALAFGATEFIGLAAAIFPHAWLGLFSDEPRVLALGTLYLRTVAPVYGTIGLASLYIAPWIITPHRRHGGFSSCHNPERQLYQQPERRKDEGSCNLRKEGEKNQYSSNDHHRCGRQVDCRYDHEPYVGKVKRKTDREVGMALVEDTGFDAFDAGTLAESLRQQPGPCERDYPSGATWLWRQFRNGLAAAPRISMRTLSFV